MWDLFVMHKLIRIHIQSNLFQLTNVRMYLYDGFVSGHGLCVCVCVFAVCDGCGVCW